MESFNVATPLVDVVQALETEVGTVEQFLDDLEEFPPETLMVAMTIVNDSIGSNADLGDDPIKGRTEDILMYAVEVEPDTFDWAEYIGEAREAE